MNEVFNMDLRLIHSVEVEEVILVFFLFVLSFIVFFMNI